MKSAWIGGVLCVLTIVVGVFTLDRLPPTIGPLLLIPPLLAGIGIVLQSTAGRGLGTLGHLVGEDSWVHVPLVLLGWTLITIGCLGLLRLPSTGAVAVLRLSQTLPDACVGEAPDRVPLELIPTLDALDQRLATLQGAVRRTGVDALRELVPRCGGQLESALEAPEGTHGSWGLLREWIVEHPEYGSLKPAVVAKPLRPRRHRPRRPSVQLDLTP